MTEFGYWRIFGEQNLRVRVVLHEKKIEGDEDASMKFEVGYHASRVSIDRRGIYVLPQ
jgi:hypothetical protein